jgi:signal transduction histidine kinase
MTGQFSDFLAANAARVAQLLERQTEREPGVDPGGTGRGPTALVNAVLLALTADDSRPLITYYRLTDAPGLTDRLWGALRDLGALRQATMQAAQDAALDSSGCLALALAAADELDSVGRRLALAGTQTLESKLEAATTASSTRGTSMAITMHELRRPLTILNSYSQLLSAGMLGALPETASVAIEGINASTQMMVRMVNALAELARLEDPDDRLAFEDLTAQEVVEGAIEHVGMEAKLRGDELAVDVDPQVRLTGDRRRLVLALTNLIGNAVKHGPQDSSIEVRAWAAPDGAHFRVRDHGPGFAPEDAAHLFDKYFRSVDERHRKVPGSGLGLYIVKTVAERHNGSVAARSQPGEGAEFEMIIPMQERAA